MNLKDLLLEHGHQNVLDDLVSKGVLDSSYKVVAGGMDSFVTEYLSIFPKGVKSGGYYVRGDFQSCKNKFRLFFQIYPYSKKEVLSATRHYVDSLEKSGYKYIQLSSYFIMKNGVSSLASYIEANKDLLVDDFSTTL